MLKIYENGDRFWKNEGGQLHRIGGPAVEMSDGSRHWYINGNLHRVDGPSCEYSGGTKFWYIGGTQYTEKEYREKVGVIC